MTTHRFGRTAPEGIPSPPPRKGLQGLRVLIIGNHGARRGAMRAVLEALGAEVQHARGVAAIPALDHATLDVVLAEAQPHGMDAVRILRAVRARDPDVAVLLVAGSWDTRRAEEAVRLGVFDCLEKPLDHIMLLKAVARAGTVARTSRIKRFALPALGRPARGAGDRAGLDVAFDRALANLEMAFQPIVRIDGTVYGYEALMRTTECSLRSPHAVLDAAKRLGRLSEVGERTRNAVANHVLELDSTFSVFMNLHPADLSDASLWDDATALGQVADRVVLELSACVPHDQVKDANKAIRTLREVGFRLALDDIGTDDSGMDTWLALRPHFLKLDMSLVRNVDADERKARAVRSIASAYSAPHTYLVAKGVETVGERNTLFELGCHLFQGDLFARPSYPFPEATWPRLRCRGDS